MSPPASRKRKLPSTWHDAETKKPPAARQTKKKGGATAANAEKRLRRSAFLTSILVLSDGLDR